MPHMGSDVNERSVLYDTFSDRQNIIYSSPTPADLSFSPLFSDTEQEDPNRKKRAWSWGESTGALRKGEKHHYDNDSWDPMSPDDYFSSFWGKNWVFNLSNASDYGYGSELDKTENSEPPIRRDNVVEKQQSSRYDYDGSPFNDRFGISYESTEDISVVRNKGKRFCNHALDEARLCVWIFGCSQHWLQKDEARISESEADKQSYDSRMDYGPASASKV